MAGERACPPKTWAAPRYQEFLEAISDPGNEEHENTLVWVGGVFDPEGFDLNCVNRKLRRMRL